MNIKLTVEYEGTRYRGWQSQPEGETIQSVLERAVSIIIGKSTRVTGAGRTDAGVHALGQVANYLSVKPMEPYRIQRGLNALTPHDITVREVEIAPDGFHARKDGRSRVYEFRIFIRPTPSPFHFMRSWHLHDRLDVESMRASIQCLTGRHDFSSFRASGCDATHAVRTVHCVSLEQKNELLVFTIEASGFLRHMVRNIVGTLVQVGRGLRSPEAFAEVLAARDRTQAGPTAPAHGLYLVEVKY